MCEVALASVAIDLQSWLIDRCGEYYVSRPWETESTRGGRDILFPFYQRRRTLTLDFLWLMLPLSMCHSHLGSAIRPTYFVLGAELRNWLSSRQADSALLDEVEDRPQGAPQLNRMPSDISQGKIFVC